MQKLLSAIQVSLATLFLTLSYELKLLLAWASPARLSLNIVITLLLTTIAAPVLSRILIRTRLVRRLAAGETWIEGFWKIQTFDGKSESPVACGLIQYSYKFPDLELRAESFKRRSPSSPNETSSKSRQIALRESDLLYINHFEYYEGLSVIQGVAVGQFHCQGNPYPSHYSGMLHYFDGRPSEKQTLTRIRDSTLRTLKKLHRERWIDSFLESMEQQK